MKSSADVDVRRFLAASPCSVRRTHVNPNEIAQRAPVVLGQVRAERFRSHVSRQACAPLTRLWVYLCKRFDQRWEEQGRALACSVLSFTVASCDNATQMEINAGL